MSWRAPGSGGEIHTNRPMGSAMTCTLSRGEDLAIELANAAGFVDYVQVADVPGRGEPGSGGLDWTDRLAVLRVSGYDGPIGLEYVPTIESGASVRHIRSVAQTV
jgi:hydroxypyruvate isomerase